MILVYWRRERYRYISRLKVFVDLIGGDHRDIFDVDGYTFLEQVVCFCTC